MKVIIQRVLRSSVSVDNKEISSIGKGLNVLVGVHQDDTECDAQELASKILKMRLFDDSNGKRWMKSVSDMNYEILCVSQFTLYHSLKGNKPDFRHAMKADASKQLYNSFLSNLKSSYKSELIKDGQFGAMMEVSIVNDGPVTIQLESSKKDRKPEQSLLRNSVERPLKFKIQFPLLKLLDKTWKPYLKNINEHSKILINY